MQNLMRQKSLVLIVWMVFLAPSCSPLSPPEIEGTAGASPRARAPVSTSSPDPSLSTLFASGGEWWQPVPGTSWGWQLGEQLQLPIQGEMIDLDLFETSPELIQELREGGQFPICYLSAGSWEEWRPDADQFPAEVLGRNYPGWPGEKWLDIRQIEVLAPILEARLDLCAAKGFAGLAYGFSLADALAHLSFTQLGDDLLR